MPNVLTINGGSSSIRFAVFEARRPPNRVLSGKMERIGGRDASLTWAQGADQSTGHAKIDMRKNGTVVDSLLDWLESRLPVAELGGVGHRVVHGMLRTAPERVTEELLRELKGIVPFDPEHLPREIELIETVRRRYPQLPQAVCFDTAFHRSMPLVARQLPIPRRFAAKGIQRYGFHGLSYTFLMQELERLGDPAAVRGRVILAHLGNGASLAAVKDGQSMDTSMGFTPAAGLVMGTRPGDLDPGLMSYLASADGMTAAKLQTLVNHESGLLGISETSADVRDLLERESSDPRAAEALALFCYQAKKWIGSFCAALGGLDTLVFTGGIGENAAPVRERICDGLAFVGVDIDQAANERHAARISADAAAVSVRVIRTDEESVIATLASRVLGFEPYQEK